jgi:hypothetical protein
MIAKEQEELIYKSLVKVQYIGESKDMILRLKIRIPEEPAFYLNQ